MKLQNEALSGVKILKLNAWEEPLRTEVEGVRAEEMVKAKGVANRNAMNTAIMNTGPTLVAVAAFSIYSGIMRKPMTPDVIFPSITLFNLLRFPVMFYPRCLSLCADAIVALRRLQKYFLLPEAHATYHRASRSRGRPAVRRLRDVDARPKVHGERRRRGHLSADVCGRRDGVGVFPEILEIDGAGNRGRR